MIEQLRKMLQHHGVAGKEGDAGLFGGGLQRLVAGSGKGQDRNVACGGGFLDEGDGIAGAGTSGNFSQNDERFFALAFLLELGGIVDGLDAITHVLQSACQLTAEQQIGTTQ